MLSNPEIKLVEPQQAMAIHVDVAPDKIGDAMSAAFAELYEYVGSHGGQPGMPFSLYNEMPGATIVCEAGILVPAPVTESDRVRAIEVPGGRVACALHTGSYDSLGESYGELERWLRDAAEVPGGPAWEVYLNDPMGEPNPAKWQTEIYWKLAAAVEGE